MAVLSKPHLLDTQRWKDRRVGLLGGSFNPPHEGHLHISLAALAGLGLDALWWLVSPQNPLKEDAPRPLQERVALSEALVRHPKILITDLEKDLETNFTYETIKKLRARFPGTHFVWVGGMDNALGLHEWQRWKDLLTLVPTLHITRMPARLLIQKCPLRLYHRQKHVILSKGGKPPLDPGTSYWLLQKSMVDASSTALRAKA